MSYCSECLKDQSTYVKEHTRIVTVKKEIRNKSDVVTGTIDVNEPVVVRTYFCCECNSWIEHPQANSLDDLHKIATKNASAPLMFGIALILGAIGAVSGSGFGGFGIIIGGLIGAVVGPKIISIILPRSVLSAGGGFLKAVVWGAFVGAMGFIAGVVLTSVLGFRDKDNSMALIIAGVFFLYGFFSSVSKSKQVFAKLEGMQAKENSLSADQTSIADVAIQSDLHSRHGQSDSNQNSTHSSSIAERLGSGNQTKRPPPLAKANRSIEDRENQYKINYSVQSPDIQSLVSPKVPPPLIGRKSVEDISVPKAQLSGDSGAMQAILPVGSSTIGSKGDAKDFALSNELTKLKSLLDCGAIDEDEYKQAKKKILAA